MPFRTSLLARVCALSVLIHAASADAAQTAADFKPAWIVANWGAKTHDNGRGIYGVGIAKPQGDVRGLRALAQADAKAAVLREVAAFTAAVQADASSPGRAIAVSLQAFGPLIERLVRPMDHYVAADGTHYSLMAVQENTLMAVVQKARDKGLILDTLDAEGFASAFDKAAKVDAPVSAFVGAADSAWTDTVPAQDMAKLTVALGPEPAWVQQGASAMLPSSIYLCGVGKGKSRAAAAGGGASVLSRNLMAPAIAAASALDKARTALGLSGVKGRDAKDAAKAAYNTVAPFVLGQQVWTDKKGNAAVASCVLRVKTYVALKEQLKVRDTQIGAALDRAAKAAGSDAKKEQLNAAFAALQERAALVAMLRGINISGLGQAGAWALSDLAAAQNPEPPQLRLAVSADGPYWLGLANAVVGSVHHPKVTPALAAVTPQYELLLTAQISMPQSDSKAGKNASGQYQATGQVNVQLQDVRSKQTLLTQTFAASGAAAAHVFDAERAVMRKLNQQVSEATQKALAALP